MMNIFCNGCGMCCKLIPIKKGENILVRDGFQIIDEEFQSFLIKYEPEQAKDVNKEYTERILDLFPDVEFYKCSYFADNKCTINRKPSLCRDFPYSPLAIVPEECACLGEVFIKNEELKRRIRKIKEEILDYETLISTGDKDSTSYRKIIDNLNRFVTKYKDFGSDNW